MNLSASFPWVHPHVHPSLAVPAIQILLKASSTRTLRCAGTADSLPDEAQLIRSVLGKTANGNSLARSHSLACPETLVGHAPFLTLRAGNARPGKS
jgi:hypothetical protein